MQAQIKQWGNSQGIRISKEIMLGASIDLNDVLDVEVAEGKIVLLKRFRHKTLEERAEKFDGLLSIDNEYDWGEPVGGEIW